MNRSEKFWDRVANYYDREEKKDEETYIRIIEETKKYLRISDTVLDYGCGTGRVSNIIAGNVKEIYAVDTSSKMIKIAKRKTDELKIDNIVYDHSAIFDEKYKRGSFDVILVFYTLHLFKDAHKVMLRMNELLKPGGLIISATPCMGEKTIQRILLSLISKTGLIPGIRFFKIHELEDLIENSNFKIIDTDRLLKNSPEYFVVAKKI